MNPNLRSTSARESLWDITLAAVGTRVQLAVNLRLTLLETERIPSLKAK